MVGSGSITPLILTPSPSATPTQPPPPAQEEQQQGGESDGKGKKKKKSEPSQQQQESSNPQVENIGFNVDGSLVAAVFRHRLLGVWRTGAGGNGEVSLLAER